MVIFVFFAWLGYICTISIETGLKIRQLIFQNKVSFDVANNFILRNRLLFNIISILSLEAISKIDKKTQEAMLAYNLYKIVAIMSIGLSLFLIIVLIHDKIIHSLDVTNDLIMISIVIILSVIETIGLNIYFKNFNNYCIENITKKPDGLNSIL